MALTPEQVLNKHFQTTQFRRGYEERDVDDFLDEIVAEMRSLIEQRDDYLKQLNDCRASKNQGAVRGDGATAAMPVVGRPGDDAKLGGLTAKIQDAERAFKAASDRAAKAKADADNAERAAHDRIERAKAEAERAEAAAKSAVDNTSPQRRPGQAQRPQHAGRRRRGQARPGPGERPRRRGARRQAQRRPRSAGDAALPRRRPGRSCLRRRRRRPRRPPPNVDAAGVIALAQRLHDEHVAAGESRRNELIAEAEGRHRRADLGGPGQARRADQHRPGSSRRGHPQAEQISPPRPPPSATR